MEKLTDVIDLADSELVDAVFHHALHCMGGGSAVQSDRRPAFERLPLGLQTVFATTIAQMEILNGGFHQYFWNPSRVFAPEAREGFARFGAPEHSALMEEAISVFADEQDQQQRFKAERTLGAFSESAQRSRLNELDDRFYDAEQNENLAALQANHIRAHPEEYEVAELEPCYADLRNCSLMRRPQG